MFVLEATRDCWTHPFPNDVLFCCLCVHDIYTDVLLCMDTTFWRGPDEIVDEIVRGVNENIKQRIFGDCQ